MKKRIIGIDPGTYCTGYGLLEVDVYNNKILYLSSGCIKSNSSFFSIRLNKIYKSILDIFLFFNPFEIAIEKTFLKNNLNSSFRLSQINGVIILAAVNNFIPIYEYNINKVKSCIFSKTNINKKYINYFIKDYFNLNYNLDLNISDALSVAMAHIYLNYI